MMEKGNERAFDVAYQSSDSVSVMSVELQRLEQHQWYSNIIFLLINLTCPSHLVGHKRRNLRLKATKYCKIQDGLGWRNPDGLKL